MPLATPIPFNNLPGPNTFEGMMLLEIIMLWEFSSIQLNLFDCAKRSIVNGSIAGFIDARSYCRISSCSEPWHSHCPCVGRLPTVDLGRWSNPSTILELPRDWAPFRQWDVPNDWQLIAAGGRRHIW
jgi:hypothetical protein